MKARFYPPRNVRQRPQIGTFQFIVLSRSLCGKDHSPKLPVANHIFVREIHELSYDIMVLSVADARRLWKPRTKMMEVELNNDSSLLGNALNSYSYTTLIANQPIFKTCDHAHASSHAPS
jgi:hypothetical protein